MADFRSEPSDTPEGKGRARRAWDAYARTINAAVLPVMEPSIEWYARKVTVELVGFWVMWHLHGGFEGLIETGMHPSTVWRKVKRFRQAFGAHPDEYVFPGITLDPAAYWEEARQRAAAKGK